ncbi:TPA: hypothetical protein DCR49_07000 [Candidatus Delongbacteria bacterium]|nr:hypothetical protein [Candidatus Delongbacteria bacterium]
MSHSVLLDTNFLIKLLKPESDLHENAKGYFKYFLDKDIAMKVSTISIAEYCVRGKIDELPLRNLQIIPFNIDHATKAGEFANIVFKSVKEKEIKFDQRAIIPNDTKIFAQADLDPSVIQFVTSDKSCKRIYDIIKDKSIIRFEIIDIHTTFDSTFGILGL